MNRQPIQPWQPLLKSLQERGYEHANLSELVRFMGYSQPTIIKDAFDRNVVRVICEAAIDEKTGEVFPLSPMQSLLPQGLSLVVKEVGAGEMLARNLSSVDGAAYLPGWLRVLMRARVWRKGLLDAALADPMFRSAIVSTWLLGTGGRGDNDMDRVNKAIAAVTEYVKAHLDG